MTRPEGRVSVDITPDDAASLDRRQRGTVAEMEDLPARSAACDEEGRADQAPGLPGRGNRGAASQPRRRDGRRLPLSA